MRPSNEDSAVRTPPSGRRVAFFDCFSGASGDMILGALVDAGVDASALCRELAKLGVDGYRIDFETVTQRGLAGTQARVSLTETHPTPRTLSDIEAIIQGSTLSDRIRERALETFRRLAAAEAHVHGIAIEAVHFHEVGAVDAIVDVVGAHIGLEQLGVGRIYASSLPLGRGMVTSSHGPLPLPAPATLRLIAEVGAPTRPADIEAELVTPTGAAILTTVAQFVQPPMAMDAVGIGFGRMELPWPNALRLWLGNIVGSGLRTDQITVIQTNLDDCTPEQAGYAMDRLLQAGALDVFFTPIQMKKNRPAILLSVLAEPGRAHELATVILRETTSLGVRFHTDDRLICPRRGATVATAFGDIAVKVKSFDGQDIICPEYEACAAVARASGVPLGTVYAAVLAASVSREA